MTPGRGARPAPHLLIVKTGPATAYLGIGDNDDWFRAALAPTGATSEVVTAFAEPLPPPDRFDGVIVTGSSFMVTDPAHARWVAALGEYLGKARVPVLGVCFGSQLVAHALGGRVRFNPSGPEQGTRELELTEAGTRDPLFAGLPRAFAVHQTHSQHVEALPPGAVLLAGNAHTPVQAFRLGNLHGVQFHPEMTPEIIGALVANRRSATDAKQPGKTDADLASIAPAPQGAQVLRNWVERCVAPAVAERNAQAAVRAACF